MVGTNEARPSKSQKKDPLRKILPNKSGSGPRPQGQEKQEKDPEAQPLQMELEENHLAENPLLPAPFSFTCTLCMETQEAGEGILLSECLHSFCNDCLQAWAGTTRDSVLRCPFQVSGGDASSPVPVACDCPLPDREVRALLGEEGYQAFLRRSLKAAQASSPTAFQCRQLNCEGWVELEPNFEGKMFQCPACKSENCIKCEAVHRNLTCAQWQDRVVSDEMDTLSKTFIQDNLDRKRFQRCPHCRAMVEKNGGCLFMRCFSCKRKFTWKGERLQAWQDWFRNLFKTEEGKADSGCGYINWDEGTGTQQTEVEDPIDWDLDEDLDEDFDEDDLTL